MLHPIPIMPVHLKVDDALTRGFHGLIRSNEFLENAVQWFSVTAEKVHIESRDKKYRAIDHIETIARYLFLLGYKSVFINDTEYDFDTLSKEFPSIYAPGIGWRDILHNQELLNRTI